MESELIKLDFELFAMKEKSKMLTKHRKLNYDSMGSFKYYVKHSKNWRFKKNFFSYFQGIFTHPHLLIFCWVRKFSYLDDFWPLQDF